MVTTIGAKRTRTALTRLVGRINPDTGAIADESGKKSSGANLPLFHVPGRILEVTKRHRESEWGVCEYKVECLEDGGYKLLEFSKARKDLTKAKAKNKTYKTGQALLKALTGKEKPGTMVYRWFGLEN